MKKTAIGVVYSTNPDFQYQYEETDSVQETLPPEKQKLRVQLDKHARAGKQVTLITGFVGTDDDLSQLAREIKVHLGVGGAAKSGEIVIQGDFRTRIAEFLTKKHYNVKQ